MQTEQRIQGRIVTDTEMEWLCAWVSAHSHWSRKRLARELCRHWHWQDARGRLKDFAARSLLLKLAARGRLTLPPLQTQMRRRARPVAPLPGWVEPPPLAAPLTTLLPLQVERVGAGSSSQRVWAFYLHRYHYLGLRVVGENAGYLVRDQAGRDLACLLFGAAAWRCAPRDQVLGWSPPERLEQLNQMANNTRFLILPWVRVPQLASHVLGQVARRIAADWRAHYGHGLQWLETFVERARFAGTCYRAANWRCVGQTQGRSRQDRTHQARVPVKDVYLYALRGGGR